MWESIRLFPVKDSKSVNYNLDGNILSSLPQNIHVVTYIFVAIFLNSSENNNFLSWYSKKR